MTNLSYRMMTIGGAPAGLLGLEELFNDLYTAGLHPDDAELAEKLIKGVRQHNYIPKPALSDYQEVLLREYHKYFQDRSGGKAVVARDYGQWQGFPREQIPWFPVVSADLCDGCGKCIEVCPKEVFEVNEDGKVEVIEPFLCIVGCCFCKSACDPKAILMPDRSILDTFTHGQRPSA
jgi:NAD-dependent dihydropyrimidine dehydrogenase PreA subunit